jgi:hypothetical protein
MRVNDMSKEARKERVNLDNEIKNRLNQLRELENLLAQLSCSVGCVRCAGTPILGRLLAECNSTAV